MASEPRKTVNKKSTKKSVRTKTAKKSVRKTGSVSKTDNRSSSGIPAANRRNVVLILMVMILSTVVIFMGIELLRHKSQPSGRKIERASVQTVVPEVKPEDKLSDSVASSETEPKTDTKSTDETDTKASAEIFHGKIYLLYFNENTETLTYRSVKRPLRKAARYEDALSMLLHGPVKEEGRKGFESSLSTGMRISSVSVKNGIATVDVSKEFVKNSFGDIGVARVNQVFMTLTQFPEIKALIITVNGKPIDTMDDGRHFTWPQYKRL
ncbi:MAG: GerMN domain-containing protein [Spirochaetes bacterium]|nr:GerMN domain-containing protein [Spirochaetota bacterium]